MEKAKAELEAIIDWVQVTFKEIDYYTIIEQILCFDYSFMQYEKRGRFRYAGKWSFSGIEVLTPPKDYLEMGHHLYMTGSACRAFEIYLRAQNRTWYDFFEDCLNFGGKFTRLDIAVDDRKPYLYIRELDQKIKNGESISKFRNLVFLESRTVAGEKNGCTINLGSGESLCSMVFYEKNYEQSKKTGLPVETYGEWNRYEVRLKREMATNCVKELVNRKNICFIGLGIMNHYLRILVQNNTDANKARWKTWQPWEELIAGIDKLNLSMRPAPRTLEQKKQWIANYVAPTLKMIQMADDNLGEDFLRDVIDEALLKENQIKLVEDYLLGRYTLQEETEGAERG